MIIVKIIGGLGNQLFQYATGRALSLKFNTTLKLDLSFFEQPKYHNVFKLDKFDLPFEIAKELEYSKLMNRSSNKLISILVKVGVKFPPYYRKSHLIEKDVEILVNLKASELSKDYYLDGWFANQKYFRNYRNILLNELDVKHALSKQNMQLIETIKRSNSVSVHIRRGDYLTNSHFHNLSSDYYIKAIQYLQDRVENPVFYFFSDDIQWVKNEYSFLEEAIFVEGNSLHEGAFTTNGDIDDLMLMKTCKHNIIANSTFSWWAAWMNTSLENIVVAPKIWYDNEQAQLHYEKNNFVPDQWIKI